MKLNPLFSKLAILAVVTVLICVVLAQIGGLVTERRWRQREAAQTVEQSLAGPQALAGPLLVRACKESWTVQSADGRKESVESRDFWLMVAPTALKVGGGISPEVRHRGLFKVNTYLAQLNIEARWDSVGALAPRAEHPNGRLACEDPAVVVTLSDTRGIRAAEISRDGHALNARPGSPHPALRSGLHAVLPGLRPEEPLVVSAKLSLVGSQRLGLVPAAEDTDVTLQSSWPHPSFTGQFLPVEHQIGVSGFTAHWQVSSLASTAVADLMAGKPLPALTGDSGPDYVRVAPPTPGEKQGSLDVLAVELVDPVNPYVMSDRAIKYGLMFIALTFVTVGLTELLTGRRVHPVQYLLVGLALSLFFLLLLSLSEHLPFLVAYLIAAGAAAAVLTQYAAAMLGGWWRGGAFGGGIALLYGALYVLLSREQTALVIGAVLLFAVLSAVMTLTRRLDWYGLGATDRKD
ncbi:cell envelope integrity protein CreD [Pelomonas cellulosilytica]|uniref:Cell envelope integrity protein CreD n=1 Tax=Pelomonas cellulosilytica TaxID=2906762 RepID=A0ABS8XXL9_9BURK|nr:cell envelope integrity protein CreD [Pelomonas sp. P8]MCE4557411.1 cell envelope integrity protein CreD [Pelomonas sp. P8]